uniref:Uncharacterized protein n=1 Tax=Oryza rufipogon TaxID=4529 RepID=A0A0E0R6H2_ORYRU
MASCHGQRRSGRATSSSTDTGIRWHQAVTGVPTIIAPCYVSTKLGSAYRPALRNGYRRRVLTAASTLVPAACGSAGGMPCVPAARGGGRKLLGVATGGGHQLRCGWPRKAVESVFQMVDRRGKVSRLIQQPLRKGKTSCGDIRVSLRAGGGGGGACRCR